MLLARTVCRQTTLPVIILGTPPSGGGREKHQPIVTDKTEKGKCKAMKAGTVFTSILEPFSLKYLTPTQSFRTTTQLCNVHSGLEMRGCPSLNLLAPTHAQHCAGHWEAQGSIKQAGLTLQNVQSRTISFSVLELAKQCMWPQTPGPPSSASLVLDSHKHCTPPHPASRLLLNSKLTIKLSVYLLKVYPC